MADERDWVVLFVDMVDSTRLKYRDDGDYFKTLLSLYDVIGRAAPVGQRDVLKLIGDGAMICFLHDDARNGASHALAVAQRLLQFVDDANLRFRERQFRIRIRVGIAGGRCQEFGLNHIDLIGAPADLAARLCDSAEPDTVLIDQYTREASDFSAEHFIQCTERLPLRGIPLNDMSFFWFLPHRLAAPSTGDPFARGLMTLYPDRAALAAMNPSRWIQLAAPGSTILVAGRTLIGWMGRIDKDALGHVERRNLKLKFMMTSIVASRYLTAKHAEDLRRDLPRTRAFFMELANRLPTTLEVRESMHAILDGTTCAEVSLPGVTGDRKLLLVTQDVNSGCPAPSAPALLWACTCGERYKEAQHPACIAHGLRHRTEALWNAAEPLREHDATG